jgi:signal peptidase I
VRVRNARAHLLLLFAAGAAAVGVVTHFGIGVYRVGSASMEPTLHCAGNPGCRAMHSDVVVVSRWIYRLRSIHRGDVVAIRGDGRACARAGILLKRIVGLPGEHVLWTENRLRIASARTPPASTRRAEQRFHEIRVPANEYFVVGDNRRLSCDSRSFGPVARDRIYGKVIAKW